MLICTVMIDDEAGGSTWGERSFETKPPGC